MEADLNNRIIFVESVKSSGFDAFFLKIDLPNYPNLE